jgi:hypothetical protein
MNRAAESVPELVRLKAKEEIANSLSLEGRNKGMWFNRTMLPYHGGLYYGRQRIQWFIDERRGKLPLRKNQPVTPESAVCSGSHSVSRLLCHRAIYPHWREFWLERAVKMSFEDT